MFNKPSQSWNTHFYICILEWRMEGILLGFSTPTVWKWTKYFEKIVARKPCAMQENAWKSAQKIDLLDRVLRKSSDS